MRRLIYRSNNQPALAVLAVSICLTLTACDDPTVSGSTDSATNLSEDNAASSAGQTYERGRDILYNAKTRYEYPEAIKLLEKAVEEDGTNAAARFSLIYAYSKTSNFDKAAEQLVSIQTVRGELPEKDGLWLKALEAKITDDRDREVAAWQEVVETFPKDRWAWYELSSSLMAGEQYEESAQAAEQALALEPDPSKWEASWIYYLHSKALYRNGQYERAIEAAKPGQENKTTWRSTFYRMALAEVASGRERNPGKSVNIYRQISADEGRNSESYTEANIALFYFELGDYENAVKHARMSFELSPNAYPRWALGYSLIENGNVAEALQIVEEGLESNSENTNLLAAKAWALYRLDRFEESRDTFLTAQSTSPRKQYWIERDLKIVERAIDDPDAEKAPPVPWLG